MSDGKSYNSDILINGNTVTKIIGKKTKGFSREEAQLYLHQMQEYRLQLNACSILVPAFTGDIRFNPDWKQYAIVIEMPKLGIDLQDFLIAYDWKLSRKAIANTVSRLNEFLLRRDREVGIDSKTANFMLDPLFLDDCQFVDLFPPRYQPSGSSKPIVEIPEPKTLEGQQIGYWKHYTPEGIFAIFLLQTARVKPDWFSKVKEVILENTTFVSKESIYFQDFRLDGESIDSITNMYQMRLLALFLAEAETISMEELEGFFLLTHFEDEKDPFTLNQLRSTLKQWINRKGFSL